MEGGCGALGSEVAVSGEEAAAGGGWGELREARGAAAGEAGRGRMGSGRRRGEKSRRQRLRESPPF